MGLYVQLKTATARVGESRKDSVTPEVQEVVLMAIRSEAQPLTFTFTVLCEKQDEACVAHCVETGLVSASVNEIDAISKMSKMLVRLVMFALKNDRLADIYHFAPKDVINQMIKIERMIDQSTRPIMCDHKQIATTEITAYAATC
jgi:hypothetical protein